VCATGWGVGIRLIVYKKHEGQSYAFYRECMCEAPKQFKPGKKGQQTTAYGIAVSPLQPHQLIVLMSDSNLYVTCGRLRSRPRMRD
jgi:hypothetical protein